MMTQDTLSSAIQFSWNGAHKDFNTWDEVHLRLDSIFTLLAWSDLNNRRELMEDAQFLMEIAERHRERR